MNKYQVFIKITGEVVVNADSYEEAKRKAEEDGYGLLQYCGELEVEDICEFD